MPPGRAGATLRYMRHVPPPAEELALLDHELARLDARRLQLLSRRAWLVSVLRAPAASPVPPAAPLPRPYAPPATAPAPGSGHGTQNVLLVLGGLLLAVAAIAFTLFSWGEMGIAGRAAVLAVVTAGALVAPPVLLRRGLPSTAEAVSVLALLLTVLDAVALHAVAAPGTDGLTFWAVATAVLASAWTLYGLLPAPLRTPLPAAVVAGQLPLVLAAWAVGASATGFGWALLVTAAADVAVASRYRGTAVRVTACAAAVLTGPAALALGLGLSVAADGAADAVGPGVLLVAGAAVAVAGAWRAPGGPAVLGGLLAGLAVVAAVGGVPGAVLAWDRAVLVYLLCGAALVPVLRLRLPRAVLWGVLSASASVVAGAVLWAAPVASAALLGPASLPAGVWSGAPDGFRGALGPAASWSQGASAPAVLLVAAGLAAALHLRWPKPLPATGQIGRAHV